MTPGLIDCHTHLVFAGTRADGIRRSDCAGAPTRKSRVPAAGILSTMRAVRAASEAQLFDESAPRLAALLAKG